MKTKRLQNPTNIRFPERLKERLDTVAESFGVPSSELVRNAVHEKVGEWERTGTLVFKSRKAA
jgi:predicted DNA-binding protein